MYHSKYVDEKTQEKEWFEEILNEGVNGIKGEDVNILIDALLDDCLQRATNGICEVGQTAPLTRENIKKWFDNEASFFPVFASYFCEAEDTDSYEKGEQKFEAETGFKSYENIRYENIDWDKVINHLNETEDTMVSLHYRTFGEVCMDLSKEGININISFPDDYIIEDIEENSEYVQQVYKSFLEKKKRAVSKEKE